MPVLAEGLTKFLSILADDAKIQIILDETLKGGLITGGGAVAGGMLGGTIGLAVGGMIGGLTAGYMCRGNKQSAGTVLQDMNLQQKEKLLQSLQGILEKFSIQDLATLQIIAAGDPLLRGQLLDKVKDHIVNELCLTIAA